MPEATIAVFEDHRVVARTIDLGIGQADEVVARLSALGIDMGAVGAALEDAGVTAFRGPFDGALAGLRATVRP